MAQIVNRNLRQLTVPVPPITGEVEVEVKVGKPTMNKVSMGALTPEEKELYKALNNKIEEIDNSLKELVEKKNRLQVEAAAFWEFIKDNHRNKYGPTMIIENDEVFIYKVENVPEQVMERLTQ